MKLPADLNPIVTERMLAGGTPVWDITVTFNGSDHVYTVAELSDLTSVQVLLKAMDDGYGETWKAVANDSPVVPLPSIPEPEQKPVTPAPVEVSEEGPETRMTAQKTTTKKV